jgi:hypothetical protein
MNANKKIPQKSHFFHCLFCDYFTSSTKDYSKHCSTQKHKRLINANDLSLLSPKKTEFNCVCGNIYKHMSSLCKHKKSCLKLKSNEEISENISKTDSSEKYHEKLDKLTDIVLDIVSKNNELTKQIIEMSSKNNNNFNNSFNNNNNKTFNLQFFLNEECKNALNIRDFVESIQVQLTDLENTGKVGYVEGISQIFINNLGKLHTHDRPIHCSDFKREVLYIKNENEWIKETDDKINIKNAIKQIANKNMKQIKIWQEKNPNYNDPESKHNDKYMKIVYNSMSGSTEEEQKNNINKIIKNVAKEVIIEK